jgi:hypothetical protein
MTSDEVNKYINEVAFSGAEEFLEKYKNQDDAKDSGIIGHFGLGFYSAFMVAEKVEIITKSHKKSSATHWTCDGSPEYTLKKTDKKRKRNRNYSSRSRGLRRVFGRNTDSRIAQKVQQIHALPHQVWYQRRDASST